jgi:hypothetical protein
VIIQQAIWLYVGFTLSFRDVEDLLAERGIAVSYETVRRWVNHFGPRIAVALERRLAGADHSSRLAVRRRRPHPHAVPRGVGEDLGETRRSGFARRIARDRRRFLGGRRRAVIQGVCSGVSSSRPALTR